MPILPNITLSDAVKLVTRANPVFEPPLSKTKFTLDSSGVAGFFGGESAIRAMATVNLVPQRRWGGWYNAPGSYEVAKRYAPLAMSNLFDGIFPGGERDPAKILMINGEFGPKCIPVHSPTAHLSRIGHLGYLLVRKVREMPVRVTFPFKRRTMKARVTLVKLGHMPEEFERPTLIPSSSITFALGTILVSVGGCVACALIADWFSLASIALGIIANGAACSIIGSGKLIFKHNIPAQVENPGDVVLKSDAEIVVLVGNEGAVSPFSRAHFILQYEGDPELEPEQVEERDNDGAGPTGENVVKCDRCDKAIITCTACTGSPSTRNTRRRVWISQNRLVEACVFLLLAQFLAQLLLIPQGTLFGQLMFLATLIPSWMYHSYLSSLSLDVQTRILFDTLRLKQDKDMYKYQLHTWTEAVVFASLALVSVHPMKDVKKIEAFLDGLLPNKTDVWKAWKKALAAKLSNYQHWRPSHDNQKFGFPTEGSRPDVDGKPMAGEDLKQLQIYLNDADNALRAWYKVYDSLDMRSLRYTARALATSTG